MTTNVFQSVLLFVCLHGLATPLRAQPAEIVLPRGLELIEGNSSTAWPFDTFQTQKWHWVVDSSQLGGTAVRIEGIALRPDASVTRWDTATFENVEILLASATRDFSPATYDPTFDLNLSPLDRAIVFTGDVRVGAGTFSGPGPAPWVIEIPFAAPFLFDPLAGNDLVIQVRTPGGPSGNPFLFPVDGQSAPASFLRSNRYGHPSDADATNWTFANDAFLPALRLDVDEAIFLRPSFDATPRSGPGPLQVAFQDRSTSTSSITQWAWDFEDDGTIDSTSPSPTHTYANSGRYRVRLTVRDGLGNQASHAETDFIVVDPPPIADFDALPSRGSAPLTVTFQDRSANQPTSWAWDFDNDGTIDSTLPSPTHVYPVAGIQDVTLTVSNASGSDTLTRSSSIRVEAPSSTPFEDDFEGSVLAPAWTPKAPVGEIVVREATAGIAPRGGRRMVTLAGDGLAREVRALDLHLDLTSVAGANDLELCFHALDHDDDPDPEDGLYLSDDGLTFHRLFSWSSRLAPTRTWIPFAIDLDQEMAARNLTPSADFVVRFQQAGRATFEQQDGLALDDVRVGRARLEARFEATPRGGPAPLTVDFTDRSIVPAGRLLVAWEWDLDGDGLVDSLQSNPRTTYARPGVYDVALTVRDDLGNTATLRERSHVRAVASAFFPFEDDFEFGTLGPMYEVRAGEGGRIEATSTVGGPASQGSFHVALDRAVGIGLTTNELILHVDLSNVPTAQLVYDYRETGDENHPEDGVFLSDDGVRWIQARSHRDGPSEWTRFHLDLGATARAAGLRLTNAFRIRFTQRDDLAIPADGVLLDRLRVEPLDGTLVRYGTGCDGGSGLLPLLLTTGGLPNLGNPFFTILLRDAPPASFAVLAVGTDDLSWNGLPLPFDLTPLGAPGCTLLNSNDLLLPTPSDALGTASLLFPLPFDSNLIDLRVFAQWGAVAPPGGAPLPLVFTSGLAITVGRD